MKKRLNVKDKIYLIVVGLAVIFLMIYALMYESRKMAQLFENPQPHGHYICQLDGDVYLKQMPDGSIKSVVRE